tara:strand:+ start:55545 stop:56555 length:1011 start_codon:yes stop_codon:yes gene_type:complete
MTTLIFRFSSLGDVAITVPVLRCLSKKYPNHNFIVVSREKFKPLFEESPNASFFSCDFNARHKGFKGLINLYKDLSEFNPTRIADLHNVLRSKILSLLFKFSLKKVRSLNKLRAEKRKLTRSKNKIFKPVSSVHYSYQEVFNKLGYNIELNNDHVFPGSKPITSDYSFNFKTKNIGIAPFAKHQTKVYPLDLMQAVVSNLSKYYNIHLFGFGDELIILKKWSKAYQNVQCPSKSLTFSEELQIISNLDLMISMDSGNGHLSSIYDVPTITVWGLTHPYLGFKPFLMDDNNQLCSERKKFPLIPNSVYGNKTIKGYEGAMRSVSPKEIIDRAQEILS